MAPHSSILAWKIPWTEEPGRLQSMGREESDPAERLRFHFSLSCIGEGNGNPLQHSCLESPRDGEAWWAAVYGVAQSRTRLKRPSSSSRDKPSLLHTTPLFVNLFLSQSYNSTDWISPRGNHSKIRNCPSLSGYNRRQPELQTSGLTLH